jgi:hypothetical protein
MHHAPVDPLRGHGRGESRRAPARRLAGVVRAGALRMPAERIRGVASTERVVAGRLAARVARHVTAQRAAGGALPVHHG